MTLTLPNPSDSFIESVGCCWRVNIDEFPNIDAVHGSIIAELAGNRFCRCVVERDRPGNRYGNTAHVHVEIAARKVFGNNAPSATASIEQIEEKLKMAIEGRNLRFPSYTIDFHIPIAQIALGSALFAVVGFQSELGKHGALLTQGKLDVMRDEKSPLDYLSFQLRGSDDKMSFDITVQCRGESTYSPDCLQNSADRGSEVFNRLVLAKQENQYAS